MLGKSDPQHFLRIRINICAVLSALNLLASEQSTRSFKDSVCFSFVFGIIFCYVCGLILFQFNRARPLSLSLVLSVGACVAMSASVSPRFIREMYFRKSVRPGKYYDHDDHAGDYLSHFFLLLFFSSSRRRCSQKVSTKIDSDHFFHFKKHLSAASKRILVQRRRWKT